jgi:myo-inositol-1(or 4)-monophosphatase
MAAGSLLVAEAGGIVSDVHGKPFTTAGRHFVAANPHLHERLRAIVEPLLPDHL